MGELFLYLWYKGAHLWVGSRGTFSRVLCVSTFTLINKLTPEDPKRAAMRNLGLNELRLPTVDEAVGFISF